MSEELTSTAEPTTRLRWVKRIVHPTEDKEKLMTFLQQAWIITDFRGDERIGQRTEWRDVPTEVEVIDGAPV